MKKVKANARTMIMTLIVMTNQHEEERVEEYLDGAKHLLFASSKNIAYLECSVLIIQASHDLKELLSVLLLSSLFGTCQVCCKIGTGWELRSMLQCLKSTSSGSIQKA